jgi:hypothetical protein
VLWLVLAATVVGSALYSPALHGGFVFDDDTLPFRTGIHDASLGAWITGVRPFLMFSYWLNYVISGKDTYGYHVLNLVIHAINTGLVFIVLLRLLSLSGWRRSKAYAAAVLGATVVLIHPLATESVSYIAGRSEFWRPRSCYCMCVFLGEIRTPIVEPIHPRLSAFRRGGSDEGTCRRVGRSFAADRSLMARPFSVGVRAGTTGCIF